MEEKKSSDDVIKLLNKLYYQRKSSVGEVVGKANDKEVKLPLAKVDIQAKVVGRLADVSLSQKYRNCFPQNIEATYTFPLSSSCSVYSVKMLIGDREVNGEIEERAKAREDYQKALDDGKRACLVEQDRDEVFTINVGNIEPDEEVTVEIRYCETLTYFEDGSTEIRMPLVVAPKYIPGESVAREQVGSGVTLDTDRVQDASRISPPRLVEGFDPETDLNICVSIANNNSKLDHTGRITNLACSQHATKSSFDEGFVKVALANKRELLDRDFVLRWQIATQAIDSAFISGREKKSSEQTGMISIVPPLVDPESTGQRDIIFLLDRSGSMLGEKMSSAIRACKHLISCLGPSDRFAISAFDHQLEWFEDKVLDKGNNDLFIANEESIGSGIRFLDSVEAIGGTEIGLALKSAFDKLDDCEENRSPVVVLITDGHIGFESNVLNQVQQLNKKVRVFTVGIDSAVNFGFLERISQLSSASSFMVNPGDELESCMRQIARTIGEPLILDLKLEGINCEVKQSTLAPSMLPDLFVGRTAEIFFKYEKKGKAKAKVLLKGTFGDGRPFVTELKVSRRSNQSVPRIWAKRVMSDLEDQYRACFDPRQKVEIEQAIVKLSKQYSVLSRFTAYTVIDKEEIKTKDLGLRQTVQPVHNPHGWTTPGGHLASAGAPGAVFGHRSKGLYNSWGSSGSSGTWGASDPSCISDSDVSWGAPESSTPWSTPSQPSVSTNNDAGNPPPMSAGCFSAPDLMDKFKLAAQQFQPKDSDENSSIPGWLNGFFKKENQPDSKPEPQGKLPPEAGQSGSPDQDSGLGLLDKLTKVGNKSEPVVTKPLFRVIVAMDSLFSAWNKSWADIDNGHLPDVSVLEEALRELLESLDDHPVSFELPKLTTFLNVNFNSYCSYLSAPNHTIPAMRALKKQLNSGYDEAYAEAEAVLTRALGKKGSFWQFTV